MHHSAAPLAAPWLGGASMVRVSELWCIPLQHVLADQCFYKGDKKQNENSSVSDGQNCSRFYLFIVFLEAVICMYGLQRDAAER